MPRGTETIIKESFLAFKAVEGWGRPPIGTGNYLEMINAEVGLGKWYRDPRLSRGHWPRLCRSGWHAFPMSQMSRWHNGIVGGLKNGTRSIWLVEMFGKAVFDVDKMCAEYIRFVSKLTKVEVDRLAAIVFDLGWDDKNYKWTTYKPQYEREAQALGVEGLILCFNKPQGMQYNRYSPQLLRVNVKKKTERKKKAEVKVA